MTTTFSRDSRSSRAYGTGIGFVFVLGLITGGCTKKAPPAPAPSTIPSQQTPEKKAQASSTSASFLLALEKRGVWLGSEQGQPWLVAHSKAPVAVPPIAEERLLVLTKDQPPFALAPKNPSVFIDNLAETRTVLYLSDHSLWLFGDTRNQPEENTPQGMTNRYHESATHTWTALSQDHFLIGNVSTQVEKAVVLGTNRIIVAGTYQTLDNSTPNEREEVKTGIFLRSYCLDGSVDKRFGKNGTALLPLGTGASIALRGLVTSPKQEVLVAYEVNTYGQGGSHQSYLALYESNGRPHAPFGDQGILPIGEPDNPSYHSPVYVQTIAPTTAGFIVAGSLQEQGTKSKAWLAQYHFDGTLDVSFADRGISIVHEVSTWTTVAQIDSLLALGGIVKPSASGSTTPVIGWMTLQGHSTKNPGYPLDACPQETSCRPKSVVSLDAKRTLWLVESTAHDTPYARLYSINLP